MPTPHEAGLFGQLCALSDRIPQVRDAVGGEAESGFVVVGNHLAQHPELSLTAIGLAVHIQSLPARTPIGIKALAAKSPEGEIRIAAVLRELEAHGYLARTKERLQSGRVVTRTISYNKPRLAVARAVAQPESRPAPAPVSEAPPAPNAAADLLCGLRAHDSRLLLSERDVRRLAPAVSAWLERGVTPPPCSGR